MKSNLPALKRQIEMLSMFYPNNKIKDCRVLDLAEKYRVAEVTINRDLNDLRSMGIPINSVYGKGIQITGHVDQKTVADLIVKYIAFYHSDVIIQDALFNSLNQSNVTHIFIFSSINNAIENKNLIVINYKLSDNDVRDVLVLPCRIIQNNKQLEFIGVRNSSSIEVFEFSKIVSMRITDETNTNNYDDEINEFLGQTLVAASPKINLVLQIRNTDSINNFNIYNLKINKVIDDKTVRAEINHSSLDDLARWVIQQFGKVTVIEPKIVRDRIIELAQELVNIHKERNVLFSKSKEWKIAKSKMHPLPKPKPVKDDIVFKTVEEDKIVKKFQDDIDYKYQENTNKKFQDINDDVPDNWFKEESERYQPLLPDKSHDSKIEIELPLESLNIYKTKNTTLIQKIFKWIKRA
ncbi:MAG: helix-turn-helix transcriptional regulator [Ignavibacteria bacterium]